MPNFADRVAEKVGKLAGTSFWKTFVLTSSDFTVAQKALTGAATGDLIVEKVVLSTDSTGLAGMTNVEIGVSGETYGLDKPIVEAASNLGASAQRQYPSQVAAETTNDNQITVTCAVPFVLQAGDSLQYSGSSAVGTGAGKLLGAIKFVRVADGAGIASAV